MNVVDDALSRLKQPFYIKVLLVLIGANLVVLGYLHSPSSLKTDLFYFLFIFLMSGGVYIYHQDTENSRHYFIILSTFFLTVAGLRAFVGMAGIGLPRNIGHIGPFAVNQIWLFGLHLHHYYLGAVILLTAEINHLLTGKPYLKPFYHGAGLGLIMDEIGILLTGATYYNPVSYTGIIIMEAIILARYFQK